MKKSAIILLVLLLIFSFCGCKKNEDNPQNTPSVSKNEYDLDALLKDGSIPGVPYKLGTDIEQIKKDANFDPDADVHDHDDALTITENVTNIRMAYGTSYYCYDPQKADEGISSIVDFGEPFGLQIGSSTPDEVRSVFEGVEFEERELTSKQIYFIPMEMNGCTALTYKKDNRRIDFIFENTEDGSMLIAVNLVDAENWSIE